MASSWDGFWDSVSSERPLFLAGFHGARTRRLPECNSHSCAPRTVVNCGGVFTVCKARRTRMLGISRRSSVTFLRCTLVGCRTELCTQSLASTIKRYAHPRWNDISDAAYFRYKGREGSQTWQVIFRRLTFDFVK